jgi:hypothetical protein
MRLIAAPAERESSSDLVLLLIYGKREKVVSPALTRQSAQDTVPYKHGIAHGTEQADVPKLTRARAFAPEIAEESSIAAVDANLASAAVRYEQLSRRKLKGGCDAREYSGRPSSPIRTTGVGDKEIGLACASKSSVGAISSDAAKEWRYDCNDNGDTGTPAQRWAGYVRHLGHGWSGDSPRATLALTSSASASRE